MTETFRVVKIDVEEKIYLENIRTDPEYKGVYAEALFKALYVNQQAPKDHRYNICKEKFVTLPLVIYSQKDFYLLDALNEKIDILKSSGLIEFWFFQELDIRFLEPTFSKQRKVLTMKHLIGCFQILFIGLALSSIVFGLELAVLIHKARKIFGR